MSPAALRALAIQAATRGEWIKAADLKGQADDVERLARFRLDPYAPAFTNEQRTEAERMLAGSALTLET